MSVNPAIIPCLAYRDAHAAIDFLCEAFGFSRNMIYESGDKARIQHAELTLDGNMIMVGSVSSRIGEALAMVTPAETGGKVTASLYVVLPDPDAQIGRASCRERGVSVRVDLGGRRIIKKKQTQEHQRHESRQKPKD